MSGGSVVPVAAGQDRLEVRVLFGSVQVVVPEDARVRTSTSGRVLFDSIDCDHRLRGIERTGRRRGRDGRVRQRVDGAAG
jgi:hypothetical protein